MCMYLTEDVNEDHAVMCYTGFNEWLQIPFSRMVPGVRKRPLQPSRLEVNFAAGQCYTLARTYKYAYISIIKFTVHVHHAYQLNK